MKIAILGWGSLVWDPRELNLGTGWQEGGPILPIEFSRISDDGRLTLVIDQANGVDVPTRYATSALDSLDAAITDLHERERTKYRNRIGFLEVKGSRQNSRSLSEANCERIRTWADENQFDAVIWTALEANFDERAGEQFSLDAALNHFLGLPEPVRTRAIEYIRNAPEEVATPFRQKIAAILSRPAKAGPGSTRTA